MQLSRVLAALCGVLLCASGLFAASGESLWPRPCSARRSEVLSGALPLLLLLTNLSSAWRGTLRGCVRVGQANVPLRSLPRGLGAVIVAFALSGDPGHPVTALPPLGM